jgi:spore germination cell wall hydrolase CwlJ-like protein
MLSRWWTNLRYYWYTGSKGALVFFFCLAAVLSLSGFLMYEFMAKYPHKRELTCLALNVYFEARGESKAGQQAVAEVTMNRVASKHYPDSVCDVVYEKNWDRLRKRYVSAFSWTEFESRPLPEGKAWQRAQQAALDVYYGRTEPVLEGATLYHSVHIRPSWARGVKPVARIGRHVFYTRGRQARSKKRSS